MIKINKKNGFTLIEMLMAVSIFAMVAVLASSLFSTFANNQKRTKVSQELLNNAQYALEVMSREVKNNEIIAFGADPCSGLDAVYTQCLLFVRENGETAGFVYNSSAHELDYVLLTCDRNASVYSNCRISVDQAPAILLSEDFNKAKITALNFLVSPNENPYFDESGLINQQPKVTINLSVEYPSLQVIERVSHRLQTTVSSRVYKR